MKKFLNINTILIGLVLILGLAGAGYMYLTENSGNVALVTVAATNEEIRIPLSDEGEHSIEGGYLPTTLLVENNSIRFINSVCPDHLCEAFGPASHEYDFPACLPAGILVQIEINE